MCIRRRCKASCTECRNARSRTVYRDGEACEELQLCAPDHWTFETFDEAKKALDRFIQTVAGSRDPRGHVPDDIDYKKKHSVHHKNHKDFLNCQCVPPVQTKS
jgi:hypothetical protein